MKKVRKEMKVTEGEGGGGYHFPIKGIQKGYLFCGKWYLKG